LPLTPPPTSTYTLTHPAAPIPDYLSYATNLIFTNTFLAWVNTSLAWTNVLLARPNTFLARGNAFRLSTHRPYASLEANQTWIVANEAFQHRPQSRFVLLRVPNVLPRLPNVLPRVSNVLPQAQCVLPQD
jgi:hypothetical protein